MNARQLLSFYLIIWKVWLELRLLVEISCYLLEASLLQHPFISSAIFPAQRMCCRSHSWWGLRGYISITLPVWNTISELLAWDRNTIILLTFFDFYLDFVIFSKIRDLLNNVTVTLESIQPCLIPSLFMATKFLPGYLILDTLCCCHPETTTS